MSTTHPVTKDAAADHQYLGPDFWRSSLFEEHVVQALKNPFRCKIFVKMWQASTHPATPATDRLEKGRLLVEEDLGVKNAIRRID